MTGVQTCALPIYTEEFPELSPSEVLPQFHTLSIIVPVYNECKTVMKLLQQVARQPLSLLSDRSRLPRRETSQIVE